MSETHPTDDEMFLYMFLIFVFIVSTALIVLDAKFEIFGLQEHQFMNAVAYLFLAVFGFFVSYFAMYILYFAYFAYESYVKKRKCENE